MGDTMEYNNELTHYGVKGMRWGIRKKYEPSDFKTNNHAAVKGRDYKDYGDGRIEIKKGTNLQRLVGSNNKQDLAGETYASFTKYDNSSYMKHIAGKGFLGGGRDTLLKLKATQDLKSPSTKDAGKTFFKVLKDNPKLRDEYANTPFGKKYSDKELDNFLSGKADSKMIDEYKIANTQFMFSSTDNVKKTFYSRLQENGYNMIRDENDVESGYAKSPIILLDGSKTLKIESQTKIDERMRKEAKAYVKLYKRTGESWMTERGFM